MTTPARAGDYLDFFDRRAFTDNPRPGCYCYYLLHDPAEAEWHQRSEATNRSAIGPKHEWPRSATARRVVP